MARATRVDAESKKIHLQDRPPIGFDVASLDVGSTSRDFPGSGQSEGGLNTRPIADFVDQIGDRIRDLEQRGLSSPRVVVVGGGAAGIELALCAEARLRQMGCKAEVQILAKAAHLLPGSRRALAARVEKELMERGIQFRLDVDVRSSTKDGLVLATKDSQSEIVASDLTFWATGAAAPAFLKESGLPTDSEGFVRVKSTLQVEGYDDIFAAGDCARLIDYPWVPRAGVYAVRSGPYLENNIRARLMQRPLRNWRPQRDFLALINAGEKRALGGKWGFALGGHPVWRLKDWIDRRFMKRFQVLDEKGRPSPFFPDPEAMGDTTEEMICGGCAAKVGPSPLQDALNRLDPAPSDPSVLVGLSEADDAAVLEWSGGDVTLASVDAFRAFVDDPWLVGRVAAVNAVSDILAKGAHARHALALVTIPADTPVRESETLYQVLAGIRAALDPLEISLVGGHSTTGPELFVGLCVTGEPASAGRFLGLTGLSPGDALILTKPLGTGVLLAADARGMARGDWLATAIGNMVRDNANAAGIAIGPDVIACTDVSGFGLAGHLLEVLEASEVAAELSMEALPVLPGAVDLVRRGITSTFHHQNVALGERLSVQGSEIDQALVELLFDPQTSGGLLIVSKPGDQAQSLLEKIRAAGDPEASIIGHVVENDAGTPPLRAIFK
ncbi:selenide, water dikinase SelD [Myxococcota bacterium]|nr:selenide, water dikinase SelD [Myxococcota bacterium]